MELKEFIDPTNYVDQGTPPCAETDPEAFFPQDIEGYRAAQYYNEAGAKSVCRECPYMTRCLTYAVQNDEIGIWGGTTEGQRKAIRRAMKLNGHSIQQINLYIKR
jgi:WhiB family redox-sensing transcriptional regulator